jgi:hypothetical protein
LRRRHGRRLICQNSTRAVFVTQTSTRAVFVNKKSTCCFGAVFVNKKSTRAVFVNKKSTRAFFKYRVLFLVITKKKLVLKLRAGFSLTAGRLNNILLNLS